MDFKKGNKKKEKIIKEIKELLEINKNNVGVFSKDNSLNCAEIAKIRKNAREKDIKIKVFPNKILKVALKNKEIINEEEHKKMKLSNFFIFSNDILKILNFKSLLPKNLQKKVELVNCISNKNFLSKEKTKELSMFKSSEQLMITLLKTIEIGHFTLLKLLNKIVENSKEK